MQGEIANGRQSRPPQPGRAPHRPGAGPPRHPRPAPPQPGGDLNDQLINTDFWNDQMVQAAGIPIVDVPFVTVGSGIGSFVTVDYLRICGVPSDRMAVLGPQDVPWRSYEYLTRCSQIPRHERLRSDSASTPDNIWGFPSYAMREAWADKKLGPVWNVLTEPIIANYYTPKAGQAFESMEAEAKRIDYYRSLHNGQVRMIRRRVGGGYFTLFTPKAGTSRTKRVAFRSRFVHVAIGYPGIKLLPDLQKYRETHGDTGRVVNAYEPHELIYDSLRARPGTVIIRGSGIVASRVLQRLIDDRDAYGLQTQIIHLFRTYPNKRDGPRLTMKRPAKDGWSYQGFNYPKSVWGGQLKSTMAKLEGYDRLKVYKEISGTNTPIRKDWQEQLKRGRSQGFYQAVVGTAESLTPSPDRQGVVARVRIDPHAPIQQQAGHDGTREIRADFVIDCTGLQADVREHRLLADLLDHTGAGLNPLGRMDVERDFELRGTRNGDGKIFCSGTATLGGYFPGVDTFLGLQIAAQEIADTLAADGFCRRLTTARSIRQWWRWVKNRGVD